MVVTYKDLSKPLKMAAIGGMIVLINMVFLITIMVLSVFFYAYAVAVGL
jgi:hypothetical protein